MIPRCFNAAEATEGFKSKQPCQLPILSLGFNAAEATEGFKSDAVKQGFTASGIVSMQPKPQKGLREEGCSKIHYFTFLFQCSRSHRRV